MAQIVIINPPLDLPEIFIDNPAFNFYAPLTLFNILKEGGDDVSFVDAFDEGPIRKERGRILLGHSWETVVDRVLHYNPDSVIIYNSSFLRAEGLFNQILAKMINALSTRKIKVILADIYDSTTHYLDYDDSHLEKIYPGITTLYKKHFPYHSHGKFKEGCFFFKFPLDKVADYRSWLRRASGQGVIKDNRKGKTIFPYISSEGCNFNCQFCTPGKNQWKALPASEVISDILALKDQGVDQVFITDPYANYDQSRFKEILTYCSANHIKLHFTNGLGLAHIDEETAFLISNTVDQLYISPEHLSDSVISSLKKPFNEETIRAKIELLNKFRINTNVHFILGSPDEKRQDVNKLLDGAWDLTEKNSVKPFFQLYNSRADLFIGEHERDNIYRHFLPGETSDPWLAKAWGNFLHKFNSTDERKIIINVTYRCNNHCNFCAVGDRQRKDGDLKQQLSLITESYKQGVRLLDIDGGEPLLYGELFTLLDGAGDYSTVNITTNGRMLRLKNFALRLSRYKNVKILVSLHGPDRDVHDQLTGSAGSFSQTVAGIKNAVTTFRDTGVNFTMTSGNYKTLLDTAELVVSLGATSFNVQLYTPFGNVDQDLTPPPEAMVLVHELISRYAEKLRVSLVNFTYCQAPELSEYMTRDYFKSVRQMLFVNGELVNLADYLARNRFKDENCPECEYNVICRGHWDYRPKTTAPVSTGLGGEPALFEGRKAIKLLDIIPGYACNRKCVFCSASDELRKSNLNSKALFAKIQEAMLTYAPEKIRIGGGEPTIRKDLLSLIRYFNEKEVREITIQTNGLMLAYENFLEELIVAGLTGVNVSVPAIDSKTHENLTGLQDSWHLVEKAINNICHYDLKKEIDILISKPILTHLGEIVEYFLEKGITNLNFWYISIEGHVVTRVDPLVPSMTEAAQALSEIFATYRGVNLRSFYLPYCFLPDWQGKVWHPLEENAYVVTPGKNFFLDKGEIDIGEKVMKCKGCRYYDSCFGVRKNYLDIFGDHEIKPIN